MTSRFALVSASAVALAAASTAQASPAQCLIQIDGTTYLNKTCNYEAFNDGTGSFSIGTDDPAAKYFAYVIIDENGVAIGSWNGAEAALHAMDPLGELKRNGACRFNDRAIVCAWALPAKGK